MNILREQVIPDEAGNIQIELFGGPEDGGWVETANPTGPVAIFIKNRYRYIWDGESLLDRLVYSQDVERENAWLVEQKENE